MSEFVLLTSVKTRPVLVITGVLPEHEEVLALRLRRLKKLATDAARGLVRDGKDEALFYLQPERFPGLPVENAAIVTSLLRLPLSAIDRRTSLGSLTENELRALHERVARAHELKLDVMIVEKARRLPRPPRAGPHNLLDGDPEPRGKSEPPSVPAHARASARDRARAAQYLQTTPSPEGGTTCVTSQPQPFQAI